MSSASSWLRRLAIAAVGILVGHVLAVAFRRSDRLAGPAPLTPSRATMIGAAATALLVLVAGVVTFQTVKHGTQPVEWGARLTGGDPAAAPALLIAHGCASCHEIPGIPGARGTVGPSLRGLMARNYLGGIVANTPDNLIDWTRNARRFAPQGAMPDIPLSDAEARSIAAYLYGTGS